MSVATVFDKVRPPRRGAHSVRTWRATTASRVFVLALATGQAVNLETAAARTLPALVALFLLALVWCFLELGRGFSWTPVAEALLAATLLAGALPGSALYPYLAVPAVVAGIRHGWVTAINASLAGTLGFFSTSAALSTATSGPSVPPNDMGAAGLWLAVGLGAGLLAGWQTRSLRQVETRQAPYAAAHQLVAELNVLTRSSEVGLDPVAVARQLGLRLADEWEASRWSVHVAGRAGELEALAAHDPLPSDAVLAEQLPGRRGTSYQGTAMVPLRVGDHRFGVVVLGRGPAWSKQALAEVQHSADELAVRLETALLFDQVRGAATAEERQRLARDIHDGVAQELVALGYLVDEIEATTSEPDILRLATDLRHEIGRTVGELRFSIFDLRHEVDQQHVSGALAEYVREVSASSDLRVHLVLDEQEAPLPARTESELLRVAQEAIANVRKHARADNLWVTLTSDESAIHLEVADDGVGSAHPRRRHYGLHTMRERAERLGAHLSVHDRPGGGTVVSLTSRAPAPSASPATPPRQEVTA